MIDVHCHLNFHSFEEDYDAVIKSAAEAGVKTIINVGTSLESSQKAVELAKEYDNLYAIVGVHPHHADKLGSVILGTLARQEDSRIDSGQARMTEYDWIEQLETLARMPKVVAIGEIGMDYYNYQSNGITDPKIQKEIFINQIELAYKLKLPLQIHNRQAGDDILDILISHKSHLLNLPGMFHCMSGNLDFLKKVLDFGFYIGFDGNITYNGKARGETTELKELVKYAPIDRILTETDSPFLTPQPFRGSRNMPEYVIIIAEAIARIKGISADEVKEKTTENAEKIFRLK